MEQSVICTYIICADERNKATKKFNQGKCDRKRHQEFGQEKHIVEESNKVDSVGDTFALANYQLPLAGSKKLASYKNIDKIYVHI